MRPNELPLSACASGCPVTSGYRGVSGYRRTILAKTCLSGLLVALPAWASRHEASEPPGIDQRRALAELRRLGARKPFLTDSPDVYMEPKSLHRFFTERIYRKLRGNAYFGYDYDEGFLLERNQVQIEALNDLSPGACCQNAYRIALEQALQAQGLVIKPRARHQIGVSIVGVEWRETPNTLPGVMVEAYLRNSAVKKSLFIRYGVGHPRGLAPAIRLSAEMLASHIIARANTPRHSGDGTAGFNAQVRRER
jgi:hypothetical protein